jgi:hypothetical protein
MPDPGRLPAVSALTSGQLERTRRERAVSLALARPGSPARGPILIHISSIDAELAQRAAGTPGELPGSPDPGGSGEPNSPHRPAWPRRGRSAARLQDGTYARRTKRDQERGGPRSGPVQVIARLPPLAEELIPECSTRMGRAAAVYRARAGTRHVAPSGRSGRGLAPWRAGTGGAGLSLSLAWSWRLPRPLPSPRWPRSAGRMRRPCRSLTSPTPATARSPRST